MCEQGRIVKQSKYDRVRDREVINKRSTHSLDSYSIKDNVWGVFRNILSLLTKWIMMLLAYLHFWWSVRRRNL
jgi:hypothetical protein